MIFGSRHQLFAFPTPFYIALCFTQFIFSQLIVASQLCSDVGSDNFECKFNSTCRYGEVIDVICKPLISCQNASNSSNPVHIRKTICRYCHQLTNETDFFCQSPSNECTQPGVARSYYVARCRAQPTVICMGRREFFRMRPCLRESGKSYGTSVLLSLFLGGFGADRFYLGMWREGLGKLFTFGGLGVWSVIDFFLIVIGYISPSDDKVYWNNTLFN